MRTILVAVLVPITIFVAMITVIIMVKSAIDATDEVKMELLRDSNGIVDIDREMGVFNLRPERNVAQPDDDRFPYVAAVTTNTSTVWSCRCFASVVLIKWIVTSAHCRRPGATHRVLLYHDFVRNYTHTYPILIWRLHEKFNISYQTPKYDIAVAKLNVDYYPFSSMKPALFDEGQVIVGEAAIWKTVSTMDNKLYLTDDFERYEVSIASFSKCTEHFDIELDESMICVDMSAFGDCFVNEFGPIYSGDKLVGILAVKSSECRVKLAIFTNISYYTSWILKSTHTTYYG